MSVDIVITAGDGRAAKKVFGRNKALLEIEDVPLVGHVVSALQRSRHVARIFVVGPREAITEALARCGDRASGPKEVRVS